MRSVRYAVYDRATGRPLWVVSHSPRPVWVWFDDTLEEVRAWARGRPEYGYWRDQGLPDIPLPTVEPETEILEVPPERGAFEALHGWLVRGGAWVRKARWVPYHPQTGEILGPAVEEPEDDFLARRDTDAGAHLRQDPLADRNRRLDVGQVRVNPQTKALDHARAPGGGASS